MIIYEQAAERKSRMINTLSEQIREMEAKFVANGDSILGENSKTILHNNHLYETYKNDLKKGFSDSEETALFEQILDNSRMEMLKETMINGIQPVAGLQGPLLRKFIAKLAIKDAMPTEAVKQPVFKNKHYTPYVIEADGTKHLLTRYYKDKFRDGTKFGLAQLFANAIDIATASGVNVITGKHSVSGSTIFTPPTYGFTPSLVGYEKVDADFELYKFSVEIPIGWETTTPGYDPTANVILDIPMIVKRDVNTGTFIGHISYVWNPKKYEDEGNDISLINPSYSYTTGGGGEIIWGDMLDAEGNYTFKDVIQGHLDLETAVLIIKNYNTLGYDAGTKVATMAVTDFFMRGGISDEANTYGGSVSYDITTTEVVIGHGQHLNTPITIETIKDEMALYNIDSTIKLVDLMSTVLANESEYAAWKMLVNSYVDNALQERGYYGEFNLKISPNFKGDFMAWLVQLAEVITFKCQDLKQEHSIPSGKWVIFGNPLDVMRVTNVQWIFKADGQERSGVEVPYSVGELEAGGLKFTLVSSENIPKEGLRIMYFPTVPDYYSYMYYPYTFNVEATGYRNPRYQNVPNIMMTKREKYQEYSALQIFIKLDNNTGTIAYQ